MVNNDEHNSFKAAELLSTTINLWKLQPQACNELRDCKFKSVANQRGEITLELSICALIYSNGQPTEVFVNASPFNTSTLGVKAKNEDYIEECFLLKRLMDNLDKEFYKIITEKINHE